VGVFETFQANLVSFGEWLGDKFGLALTGEQQTKSKVNV
jgi:hypothetical protein